MSLKNKFLKEANIGAYVELIVGSKEVAGIIISLDMKTVCIKKEDGKQPTIALDSVSYYVISDLEEKNEESSKDISLKEDQENRSLNGNNLISKQKSFVKNFEERGNKYFYDICAPKVKSYRELWQNASIPLKEELSSISNSLDYALGQAHEISPADYKIQENIKKLNRLININKTTSDKAPANMLGALYYQCKSDRLSLDVYMEGDDDESAFAVAENIKSIDKMEFFAMRHVINGHQLNPYILQWLIFRMIEKDDYSPISAIIIQNTNNRNLPGYIALLKLILLANGIEYNKILDHEESMNVFSQLLYIFNKENIGKHKDMIKNISSESNISVNEKKPIIECPIYMEAKKAREQEKDLKKAEKLYIESILKNEKPSAAAADLVGVMMQQKKFSKAIKYLEEYGSKYMREESYKNVKSQLLGVKPELENMTESNRKVNEPDYFILAQKSEIEEKDLQKAMTYYKEAIKRKQKMTSGIPNLVSIYNRLEMYDDAIQLLDTSGKQYMDRSKFLNVRLSVLSGAKDIKYKQDIMDTYRQAVALSVSDEKKLVLLCAQAHLLNQLGENTDAINLFHRCLQLIEKKSIPESEKLSRQKTNVLMGLCNTYMKSEKYDKAREYAEKIIQIQPENETALSIMSGQISDELKFEDDSAGISEISQYIIHRIDKLNFENELKGKPDIKEGEFIGKPDDAKRIINSILYRQVRASVNDEIQSNNYFVIAKLIRQVLDRVDEIKDKSVLNERNYQVKVATGSFFYGNYRLYKSGIIENFDTSRYCFLETISIFKDAVKTHKCWAAATVRYIQTYFYTKDEIREQGTKLYYDYSHDKYNEEYKDDIDKVMQNNISVPIEEFVVGMLEMLACNVRVKDSILKHIRENTMSGRIFDVLGKISGMEISDSITDYEFRDIWDKATKNYYQKKRVFLDMIKETINSVFTIGQLQQNFEKLCDNEFVDYLGSVDKEYFVDIRKIFDTLIRYSEISEFDYKADTLVRADDICKRLEEKIEDSPTQMSFEKFLPMLTQLKAKIFKESVDLYGESKPEIHVELAGECSVDEIELSVRVPIAFTNEVNRQSADNVSICVTGEDVEVDRDGQLAKGLLVGGKTQEKMFNFKVKNELLEAQAFSVNVEIQYRYKKNMTEFQDDIVEIPLSIPLYSNLIFQPIENKFDLYRNGSEVQEESMFYGREKDMDNIIKQISDKNGNMLKGRCLALYGQTRTGKSSLLYHLEKKLRKINPEENVIVNVGNIGDQDFSGSDITEFLYTLLDELSDEIRINHPVLKKMLDQAHIQIEADKLLYDETNSQLYFNDVLKKIRRCIEDNGCNYHIIVMIDEFTYIYDWIRQGIMTDRVMKFWKAFIQNNDIFAIIIGQDHMIKFVNERQFTNDFGSTDLRKVTYLSEEDAKKLMYEPIMLVKENGDKINRYKESALDRLYELTAGSAFLIMNLCAGLVDYLNETHSIYITRAHVEDYLNKNWSSFVESRFFEPQYGDKINVDNDETNNENKRILYRIAKLSNKKEWTPLNSVIKSKRDKELLEMLEQRDVVIVENEERCKIKVALYKEWIIKKYGLEVGNE